jgi:hypothetical protein
LQRCGVSRRNIPDWNFSHVYPCLHLSPSFLKNPLKEEQVQEPLKDTKKSFLRNVISRIYYTKLLPGKISSEASNIFCIMRVTPSLIPKNADAFLSSLRFPSGTIGSPEGEAVQGVRPLDPLLKKMKVFKQHSCPARPRRGGRVTSKGVGLLIFLIICEIISG